MKPSNPVLVEVTRGGAVESRHLGACIVVDAAGRVVHAVGDVERMVFPRSAIKPVQALPLLETGAAEHYQITDAELALACSSHNGEANHVAGVKAWLARMDLGEADLACGIHPSLQMDVALDLARAGIALGRAHNNCSGKHAGFLCTALHMGEPLKGYERAEHPVQQRVKAAMERLSGVKLDAHACGVDGCGIPACAMPLSALARAMARMTEHPRITRAMTTHPEMVAGSGRSDSRIMAALGGRVATKIGAEGVHVAIVAEGGLGIALKIDDGAGRASDVAMTNVLDKLGLLDATARELLADLLEKPLINTLGATVGTLRPGPGLQL